MTYFTASYTCNQHIKLSPPPLSCLTLTLPLYSSLSAFLSLSLPIPLSPPSVSACCNSLDIHHIHGRYMFTSSVAKAEKACWRGIRQVCWTPACLSVYEFEGGGGGDRGKGGSSRKQGRVKAKCSTKNRGTKWTLFCLFFLNQTHFYLPPESFSHSMPPNSIPTHPPNPETTPFSLFAHRHCLTRHQHPLRGLAVSRKRKS